jgi:hypothetical protein
MLTKLHQLLRHQAQVILLVPLFLLVAAVVEVAKKKSLLSQRKLTILNKKKL